MKRILLLLVLAGVGFAGYWFFIRSKNNGPEAPKQQPLKVGKHSEAFNQGVAAALSAYFDISKALVSADTAAAKAASRQLLAKADSIPLTELKKDTTGIFESALAQLNDIKSNAQSLLQQTDVTEMRRDFKAVGDNVYPFLRTIKYEGKKLYWNKCPMAFGEDVQAEWLSDQAEIINPYLGNNHPEYKGTMLHCGMVVDSL
jgi:hypothetical protein